MNRQYHPSLSGFIFLILALVIPLFDGDSMVNADGDPARHVRHGDIILQQGDVIRTEPFLLLHSGQPFVGFESGSQVLLALSHRLGGTVGLAALTTLIVVGVLTMLLSWLMRRGIDPLLSLLATIMTALLTSIHWLARPHIFSWPLLLLLFFWLERERRPPLWWFAGLFVLWVNLHGAFVLGWMLIGFYIAGHVLDAWSAGNQDVRSNEKRKALGLMSALPISILATIVNPYGWELPLHVIEFFRDPWLRLLTQEFQSPDFQQEDRLFLLTLTGTMIILAFRPRPKWTHLVVILGTAGMALISSRNIVQYGLLAVPLLAISLSSPWLQWVGKTGFVQRFGVSARTGITWPWVVAGSLALLGLSVSHGQVAGRQLLRDGFSPTVFPVEAVSWARRERIQGRVFNEFKWGGYLVYAWPGQKVVIDGGSDAYGGAFLRSYSQVASLQPGWRDSLEAWRIDLVLLPRAGPMASELLLEADWLPLYCDRVAILLRRMVPPEPVAARPGKCHMDGSGESPP